ncbi:MAG: hypothetical protein ACRC5S_03445 [Cetobacterium sp.]|uniref:hypothetical protein n=1 Tax=Cetobacterium somerae TaxID=188913 RepID=UPI002E7AF833|nr:hypothetical protein [Cetobacterium somerae]WVJ03050.1 hypothetical protein VSU16_15070 [Cetobacterium somerae]
MIDIKLGRRTFIGGIIPLNDEEKFKLYLNAQEEMESVVDFFETSANYKENYPEGNPERFEIELEDDEDCEEKVSKVLFNGYKYAIRLFKIESFGTSERLVFVRSLEGLNLEKY